MILKITLISIIIFATIFLILPGLLSSTKFIIEIHEIGHAQEIQKFGNYPIYVYLNPEKCNNENNAGFTTSLTLKDLKDMIDQGNEDKKAKEAIKAIAEAGKLAEYNFVCDNPRKLKRIRYMPLRKVTYRWARLKVDTRMKCNTKGSDSYIAKNPDKFVYIPVHDFTDFQKENLYIYKNGELEKIAYSKDLVG